MTVQTTSREPIEGIFFRNWNASHIPEILEEIYLREIYKPYLLGKKDLIIVDVGANIGLFSYSAKDYAKQVFAIEPDSDHIEELKTMLSYNKITNVTVCPYAIGNKSETARLYQNTNTTAHSLSWVEDPKNYREITVKAFDDFMKENSLSHIDLLKMDSEGEEAKIFSSEGFKTYAPRIQTIVGEYHDWCNMEKNQFANLLTDLDYTFHWIPGIRASVFTAVRL